MFPTKVAEKIKTHILCSIIPPENRAISEKMSKNNVQADKATDDTKWRVRIACWIT